MLIAQISDLHLPGNGKPEYSTIQTRSRLNLIIDTLNNLSRRPDVILLTGDLANNRDESAYAEFAELRKRLPAPVLTIPGNHDDRSMMRAADSEIPGRLDEPIQYVVDEYAVRLIALDTTVPGMHHGELCKDRLSWLEATLKEVPERPTLIFMHHPPFQTYLEEMDIYGLSRSQEFSEMVSRHPQIKRILCGHIHRPVQTIVGNVLCTVAPAISTEKVLGLGPDGPTGYFLGTPKFELHLWNGNTFVSHLVTGEDLTEPIQYDYASIS